MEDKIDALIKEQTDLLKEMNSEIDKIRKKYYTQIRILIKQMYEVEQ